MSDGEYKAFNIVAFWVFILALVLTPVVGCGIIDVGYSSGGITGACGVAGIVSWSGLIILSMMRDEYQQRHGRFISQYNFEVLKRQGTSGAEEIGQDKPELVIGTLNKRLKAYERKVNTYSLTLACIGTMWYGAFLVQIAMYGWAR